MSDRLATGAQRLAQRRDECASRTVTLRRGASSTTGVLATPGQTLLKLGSDLGIWMQWTDRDYLITASRYVIDGEQVEPARGDEIEDETDGRLYVVMAPEGEAPWRHADGYRVTLRIHTKDMGEI